MQRGGNGGMHCYTAFVETEMLLPVGRAVKNNPLSGHLVAKFIGDPLRPVTWRRSDCPKVEMLTVTLPLVAWKSDELIQATVGLEIKS